MSELSRQIYEFGPFQLDVREGVLRREGEQVPLTQKAVETLLLLIEHRGRLVDKKEMMERLWPNTYVDENNLSVNIFMLRKALGERKGKPLYIETVQRRGYRFIAHVTTITDEANADLIFEKHTRSHITIEEQVEPDAIGQSTALQTSASTLTRTTDEQPSLPATGTSTNARRWLSTRSLLAFSIVAVAVAVAVAYFAGSARQRERQSQSATAPTDSAGPQPAPFEVKSIAVLPLKILGATDAGDDYLSVGLTDALITRIANVRQIRVLPTSAVMRYTGGATDARIAGQTLGVDAVLEGSVQREGSSLRITMQLVSVRDGATLWASKFDEAQANIFNLQDDISERVVEGLALRLSGEERERLARRDTKNTEAYRSYLKGRYYWNRRTDDGIKRAVEEFNAAISHDPLYAQAYAGLADSYLLMSEYNVASPKNSYPKAVASARRALELDEKLSEAHTSLAYALANYEWNFAEAEKEYHRAIELNPNYATAHQWYAEYLSAMERFDEAAKEIERARTLDPLSLIINSVAGLLSYHARQFDRAIEQERQTILMDPTFPPAHAYLALTYEQTSRYDEAVAEWQKFFELSGVSKDVLNLMQQTYAQSGLTGYLRVALAGLEAQAKQKYVAPFDRAFLYARLKDADKTMEWLQKTYDERQRYVVYLKVDADFDFLRADPRFIELLKNIGLPHG